MQVDILLRAPEPDDLDTLYIWENDPGLWPYSDAPMPVSRHVLKQFIDNYTGDIHREGQLRFVIVDRSSGMTVGMLDVFDYCSKDRRAGVGLFIAESFRRHHYALQALAYIRNYCQTYLGLHQLWAVVGAENSASRRLFEAAGYQTCGRLRSWIRNGRCYEDAVMYQLLFE